MDFTSYRENYKNFKNMEAALDEEIKERNSNIIVALEKMLSERELTNLITGMYCDAYRLGDKTYIQKMCSRNTSELTITDIVKLSLILGTTPNYLLGFDGDDKCS